MAGEWADYTIGRLADEGVVELQTGPFGTQLHAEEYVERGVAVVPTEAIRNRRIDHFGLPMISESKAAELRRHGLECGDILFARRGVQATGHVGLVREAEAGFICGTGAIRLRVRQPECALGREFLSHVLANPASIAWFKFHAIGATMPNLNEGIVRAFSFRAPDLSEQRAIADILGTLDDKIELNRRMSETLEAMARALFQASFGDLEGVQRAKTEGWRLAKLPEVIEVNPMRVLRKGDVSPYLDMANMPTRGHVVDEVVQRPFGSGMRFTNGDTLVARITPCLENGKTAFVDFLEPGQVGWGSTEFIVLRPKAPLPAEFAYCLARSDAFRDFAIQSMTGSSGRQRVPAESLSHFEIAVPPDHLAEAFGRRVEPLLAQATRGAAESRTLAALRDTLLPKLISGEVRIMDAERFVGRSA